MSELSLRRKYRFKVHGRSVLLVKRAWESEEHVLLKVLGFALYLPRYPHLIIEPRVDDRYRPDLAQLDERGTPLFWGECGTVGTAKIRRLARRYRQTHFAFFRWEPELKHYVALIEKAMAGLKRACGAHRVLARCGNPLRRRRRQGVRRLRRLHGDQVLSC